MKGIADTGFLVAFANRNDEFHSLKSWLGVMRTASLISLIYAWFA